MTNKYINEHVKRKFFEYLKGAEGMAEATLRSFAEAISKWLTFTKDEDFSGFNKTKALTFIKWLSEKEAKTLSGRLSLVTQNNYLRRLKRFFLWLSDQPTYKRKVLKNDVEFLRLSKKDARIARLGTTKKIPTFEDAKLVIEGISTENEIGKRDKALISFAFITGARISAIITLKMKNFNKKTKEIDQNPGDGVMTKNSKRIRSTFFPVGWEVPELCFIEWFEYLETKGFHDNDPIFPATLNNSDGFKPEYDKNLVGKDFWKSTSGARKIFEKRFMDVNLPYFHPHSFRHLIVGIMGKTKLTEEEKKAISLNLGHAHVGTTFGSYGYGNMNDDEAIKIVQKIKDFQKSNEDKLNLSAQEKEVFLNILNRS